MAIWRLIAHHEDPYDAIQIMQDRNRIAIGWTKTGDLRRASITSPNDITELIKTAYREIDNAHLGGPSLWNLYANMQPGDFVILSAKGKRICVFEVLGPYIYERDRKEIVGYAHQRSACLTNLNPEELWAKSGSAVASGQNIRWTLAGCSESSVASEAIFREGLRFSVISTSIERNPHARRKCIEHFGCKCNICAFDFSKAYGEIGEDYIHVHHKQDISTTEGEHKVDPIRDLVPLCPNCHAMIHQRRPSLPLEELASIYARHNLQTDA